MGIAILSLLTSGCQTASPNTPVSEQSSCMEIAESYEANERMAKEECGEGWRVAGLFLVKEAPLVWVTDGKTLASARQVRKQDLRYCTPTLNANFEKSFNAWNDRFCTSQSSNTVREFNITQARQRRAQGLTSIQKPVPLYSLRKKQSVINDPYLGCLGPGCPD